MTDLFKPYDPNNIFAKILNDQIPSVRVAETPHALAFMDVMPQAEGHVLVISKTSPQANLLTIDPDALTHVALLSQRIARAVQKALNAPGILIAQLNGADAGQTVPHYHVHVIPRHDGLSLALHARSLVPAETLEPVAAKIRAALQDSLRRLIQRLLVA